MMLKYRFPNECKFAIVFFVNFVFLKFGIYFNIDMFVHIKIALNTLVLLTT